MIPCETLHLIFLTRKSASVSNMIPLFTGIVRISQVIDYEETKQLEFTVTAYDSGVPQLSATAKVTVTVINVNDQDPKFEKDLYNASVKENSPPGTRVIVVKATDGDEGPFGDVSYSLIGDHAADFNIGKLANTIDCIVLIKNKIIFF